ncbi:Na(+)/H(+) antiporter subunit D [bacterium]|nr:Na(+)/H(+) antiporter subunit D [bacterium]
MTSSFISPALLFILGAFVIPLLPGRLKSLYMLSLPAMAFWILVKVPRGTQWLYSLQGHDLVLGRIDRLSLVFGYIFVLVTFIALLFALKVRDDVQHMSALFYAGGALGVTFAGDLISLYIFWEIMALASTFLILARRTAQARAAAFRYIMVHVIGGLCLLAGILLHVHQTGTTQFSYIGLTGLSSWLIFLGVAVNAAIPPLHPWLPDAYPEATVTGTVFLSAFTTKSAVYVMARMFAGTELLIVLGSIMVVFPVIYAALENDLRRVLSYSLLNQVGFMLCGVGIGTELALNGTAAHAFCHILYKALLFMAAGSVLHMTGKIKCTDLGGLFKSMPLTCLFCIVGVASISGLPLFSGFISKSIIVSALAHEHMTLVWLVLQFAAAGAMVFADLKVPYFAFFHKGSGLETKEPPLNMLVAMGLAAAACLYLGLQPFQLYSILPYPVDYLPYSTEHIISHLELIVSAGLAFMLLLLSGQYLPELRATNLDADWFYRRAAARFYLLTDRTLNGLNARSDQLLARAVPTMLATFARSAPTRLALFFLSPVRLMSGSTTAKNWPEFRVKLARALETGTVPIGLTAMISLIVFIMLYLLN